MYEIQSFPVGAFQCNCSILVNPDTLDAIIIDPGDEAKSILERLSDPNLHVRALWHTHAHLDHVGATLPVFEELSKRNAAKGWPAPEVFLHEGDRWLYSNVSLQAQMMGLPHFHVTNDFRPIKDKQVYGEGFGGVEAIFTPGHTPGSCCLHVASDSRVDTLEADPFGLTGEASGVLLSGDTLFRRSIGRTDLWGGDSELIIKSIRTKVLSLPMETVVIPGHGPLTTLEQERDKNPFL